MRTELEKRPFLIALFGLTVGFSTVINIPNILILALLLWAFSSFKARLIVAAFFVLGLLVYPSEQFESLKEQRYIEGNVRVLSMPRPAYEGYSSEAEYKDRKLLLKYSNDERYIPGDVIAVKGVLRPFTEASEGYYKTRRIVGHLNLDEAQIIPIRSGPGIYRLAFQVRDRFSSFSSNSMDSRASSMVNALLLSDDSSIQDKEWELLRNTGTVHIVAASGLHVFIIAIALQLLLSLVPVPRLFQLLILGFALGIYAIATGLDPPVIRAVIMAMLFYVAYFFRREPDSLSALGFAGLIYLLFKPVELNSIGFQLSFVTMAALILFWRQNRTAGKGIWEVIGHQVYQLARVSLIAAIAAAPLVAYHFGQLSLVSVVANLLIAFVLAPILVLSLCGFLLNGLLPAISSEVMHQIVQPLTGWISAVIETLGSKSWSAVEIPPFNAYWIVLIYVLFALTWRQKVRQP